MTGNLNTLQASMLLLTTNISFFAFQEWMAPLTYIPRDGINPTGNLLEDIDRVSMGTVIFFNILFILGDSLPDRDGRAVGIALMILLAIFSITGIYIYQKHVKSMREPAPAVVQIDGNGIYSLESDVLAVELHEIAQVSGIETVATLADIPPEGHTDAGEIARCAVIDLRAP